MRWGFCLAGSILAFCAGSGHARAPACGDLALAECLGVPAQGLEFPDADVVIAAATPRESGRGDRRHRGELQRRVEDGEGAAAASIELAWLALKRNHLEQAESYLAHAETIAAGDLDLRRVAQWTRGHVCVARGDFDCALANWRLAGLQFAGRPAWLPRHYAYALWGLGRREQALAWYSVAVRGHAYWGRGSFAARSGGGRALDVVARELFTAWSERFAPLAATVGADVDIGADGWVTRVKLLDSALDRRLLDRIQAAVAGWRFTPPTDAARAVALGTHLYIDVRGRPNSDGGHDFEVQFAGLGVACSRCPPPQYPRDALKRRLQGEVLLQVAVGADGRVQDATVADSSGHSILDAAARRAVLGWSFYTDRLDGKPQASTTLVPMRFLLAGEVRRYELYFDRQRSRLLQGSPPIF